MDVRHLIAFAAVSLASSGHADERRDVRRFLVAVYPPGSQPSSKTKPIVEKVGEIARGEKVKFTVKLKHTSYDLVVTDVRWGAGDYRYAVEIGVDGEKLDTMNFPVPDGENQAECGVGTWDNGHPWIVHGLGYKADPRPRCKKLLE